MSRIETIGNATLYLGDCREILPTLGKADAVVTDPPYGFKKYRTDDDAPVIEALRPFARKAVFGYPELLCRWTADWGEPSEWVTWWPTNRQMARAAGLPRESEAIAIYGPLYEKPRRPRVYDRTIESIHAARDECPDEAADGDVWREPSPGMGFNSHLRQHPNEKPEALLKKLILLCSDMGEIILDPFMGSGTTGVASVKLGRWFRGIEVVPEYFEIACSRLREAQRQGDLWTTREK